MTTGTLVLSGLSNTIGDGMILRTYIMFQKYNWKIKYITV
jgi:hypothetical protein